MRRYLLGDIAEVRSGFSLGGRIEGPVRRLPYLRVANVQDGHVDLTELKYVDISDSRVDRFKLQVGDVLFTEGGDFDKLGRGAVWKGEIEDCLHQNHVFAVRLTSKIVSPQYIQLLAASPRGKAYFAACSKKSTNLASISAKQLGNFPIEIPNLRAQSRVTSILCCWQDACCIIDRELWFAKATQKNLRELLCHGAKRLPGFTDPWPMVKLWQVTKPLTTRNQGRLGRDRVMGVFKEAGLAPMRKHVVAENIDRYLRLPPGAFAYNPMRINIGSIAMSGLEDEMLVSPDYVAFACDRRKLDPRFLDQLRRTRAWERFMTIAGNGSVRVRIYYADLADFEFHLPPLKEQAAILEVLSDAEEEIRLLEREKALQEKQRDALATALLSGELPIPESMLQAQRMAAAAERERART